jgi:GT2 family glycosyltransferase
MFQDEAVPVPNEDWIKPFIIPMDSKDCKVMMPGTYKRNKLIEANEIIDDDYYVTVDDDDAYESNVFDSIKEMNDDIVIISMKRGNFIPEEAPPIRQYPTWTLEAKPEWVKIGYISAQQSFVKGKIFKTHLHNEESHNWDGELIVHHRAEGEQIAYRPDLFALFNYYEPGRWAERKASLIIPVLNQHDLTYDCISTVLKYTTNCEIIIIDNGSTPPFKPPFSGFTEMKVIRNEENKGFPVAVNQGIREAKGDIIILLNNDVTVTEGWAERLTAHLNEYSIVGPCTNFCAGLQRVTPPVYKTKAELDKLASDWAEEFEGEIQEVNFVIGFCMAFNKSLFDEIGEFDESMWPSSGEEVDFCFRAREIGHKIAIVRDVYVHHEGSITFKDLHEAKKVDYSKLCDDVENYLGKKWGKDYWHKQAINEEEKEVKLAIGVPCTFPFIPASFFHSFALMSKPEHFYIHADNGNIDDLRNNIVERALHEGCTHLIMMDVDQVYPDDIIPRLLSHNLPIVGARVHRRYPPFDSLMLRVREIDDNYNCYESVEEWEEGELVEVDATGAGCVMYDMDVFKKMPKPWFKFRKQADGHTIGEDIGFCQDLKAAGYKIFVDSSIEVGHLTTMVVNEITNRLYRCAKTEQQKQNIKKALEVDQVA